MYKALVRSLLDYRDIIYHMPAIIHQPHLGMTQYSIKQLSQLQELGKGRVVQKSTRN